MYVLASVVATGGVENPTCEQIGPGIYRIDFEPTANSRPVEVFASSRADTIDSAKPVSIPGISRCLNVRVVSIST
jgi:hypothetical protein